MPASRVPPNPLQRALLASRSIALPYFTGELGAETLTAETELIRWQRLRTGRVGEVVTLALPVVLASRGEIGLELEGVSTTLQLALSKSYSSSSHTNVPGVCVLGTAELDACSSGKPILPRFCRRNANATADELTRNSRAKFKSRCDLWQRSCASIGATAVRNVRWDSLMAPGT